MMPRRSYRRWLPWSYRTVLWLLLCVLALGTATSSAQTDTVLPVGFRDLPVADVAQPTALAFTPDGRLLITSQLGQLWVYQAGTLRDTPALDVQSRSCFNSERGLLGVAVDPGYSANRYIYLYYTFRKGGDCSGSTDAVNRVSRWTLGDNNLATGELILIDNVPSPAGNHNGGDLHFGQDGYLYISIGDGGCDYAEDSGCAQDNDAARDLHILLGKILRITTSGDIPSDNPFRGANSARCALTGKTDAGKICQETFAWGLRNPFRFAFRPNSNEFFINDVGQGTWEEIDRGQPGADYGWNEREGFCRTGTTNDCGAPQAGLTNPIFAYGRSDGCATITGGAFVPAGIWPAAYDGAYLFADYVCGKIFRLVQDGTGVYTRTPFVSELGDHSATSLLFGPYQRTAAIYYTSYAGGGQVRLITFVTPYRVYIPTIAR